MENFCKSSDGKKWTALTQIGLGIILVVLEIVNVTVLNPFFRILYPGLWMGLIFIAAGIACLAFYKLEYLQQQHQCSTTITPTTTERPSSHSRIFRIIFLSLSGLSLVLAFAMFVILAVVIHYLLQELHSPTESKFAMCIVMLVLYILVVFTSVLGVVQLLCWREKRTPQPEKNLTTFEMVNKGGDLETVTDLSV
ncbi:hypothetical protein BV898_08884 [Hypsibius exemplaris]|uniref:MARVEL domain-containing protein n=1 Tax=Hypsibius exemplaris TaxID=2072580 RepID=A0A1W0WP88_HYPEX|nr:hypothetical protein BV898_08884 [Hypsibius exemplaris]